MIIIVTGASHTGKTVLAQRMLEKYKYCKRDASETDEGPCITSHCSD